MKNTLFLIVIIFTSLAACQSTPTLPDEETPIPVAKKAKHVPPSPPPPPPSPSPEAKSVPKQAESSLMAGIKSYENGDYKTSQQELQASLAAGLANGTDQIRANKLLAFIACADNQRDICKAYFLKAFAISPKFTLKKSEASHPIWGQVFKEAKQEAARHK